MRSVAYGMSRRKHIQDSELDESLDYATNSVSAETAVMRHVMLRDAERVLCEIFADDAEAQKVWLLELAGCSRKEIERELSITHRAREAARKRSSRRMAAYAQGRRKASQRILSQERV